MPFLFLLKKLKNTLLRVGEDIISKRLNRLKQQEFSKGKDLILWKLASKSLCPLPLCVGERVGEWKDKVALDFSSSSELCNFTSFCAKGVYRFKKI